MGAMAFGSLDLVVPFAGLTIAATVILAKLCLHERVSIFHMLAALCTAAGVAMTAAFGAKSKKFYTARELEDLMLSTEFLGHSSVALTMFTLFAVLGFHASKPRAKLWAFSFASMAAIAGAHVYIVLKTLADFVYLTAHGVNQFANGWVYFMLLLLLLFSSIQMWCLSQGLEKVDATWFLPVYQGLLTSTWMAMSCLIFDEFEDMTTKQLLLYVAGVNMSGWGVAALTHRATVLSDGDIVEAHGTPHEIEKEGMLAVQTDEDFDSSECPEVTRWI